MGGENKIWQHLYDQQLPNIKKFAGSDYLRGFELIKLAKGHVPSLEEINEQIFPRTGWKAVRTKVRYADTVTWYEHFAKREFIVTDYLRTWDELEFTPEPDMFHDIFGHLPYLTLPEYTEIFEMFTLAYFRANKEQEEALKRLGWFSYEFGLIREKGKVKLFGAGLLSSVGESLAVTKGKTKIVPFTIENVVEKNKAIASFNKTLFVFESIEQLKRVLGDYFDTFEGKGKMVDVGKITDKEMDLAVYD